MLLKEDESFLLDVRSDGCATMSAAVSERAVHRKIIELFKSRDDFRYIDLHIRTSRGLTGTTRVDLSNALAHMRNKCNKTLRQLTADMDYMDPSVHEFVLLQCLTFRHICLTSNPEFEETNLSVGLAMSLQHSMTLNMNGHGTNILELTCAISEPVSELLAEAMRQSRELKIFRLHLLGEQQSSQWIGSILAGLTGKATLEILHLRDVNSAASTDLAKLLGDTKCRVQELSLSYNWSLQPRYNTQQFCQALTDMTENNKRSSESVKTLLLDGIQFDPAIATDDEVASSPFPSPFSSSLSSSSTTLSISKPPPSAATTRVLPLAFPNMETLSLAAPQMPRLAFLDLPQHQLPHQLKHCYFPCQVLDIEQGRNLVEALPNVTDIPDFASDPYVEHLLDWRKILGGKDAPTAAALWPPILERTNIIMKDHPRRQLNMLYSLLQDYYRLQRTGQLVFPQRECNNKGISIDSDTDNDNDNDIVCDSAAGCDNTFDENLFADVADGDY